MRGKRLQKTDENECVSSDSGAPAALLHEQFQWQCFAHSK
jgi:hypothetical protein